MAPVQHVCDVTQGCLSLAAYLLYHRYYTDWPGDMTEANAVMLALRAIFHGLTPSVVRLSFRWTGLYPYSLENLLNNVHHSVFTRAGLPLPKTHRSARLQKDTLTRKARSSIHWNTGWGAGVDAGGGGGGGRSRRRQTMLHTQNRGITASGRLQIQRLLVTH